MFFISLFSGFALCIFYSKLFFKKIDYLHIILSLFIITSPIQLLAFTQANLISKYIYILLIIFLLSSIYQLFKYISNSDKSLKIKDFKIDKEVLTINIIALLITILLTYKMWPNVWRFEDHDINYFVWLNGIFDLDYSGPIRIPTAYPSLMSANHLTASALLIPFLTFCKINLINSYKVKITLIIFTIFNYVKTFNNAYLKLKNKNNKSNKFLIANLILIFSFILFAAEFDYSLAISNYPIIILILRFSGFCICNLEKRNLFKESYFLDKTLIFLCLLSISKAVTFPIFIMSIFFLLISQRERFNLKIFFAKRFIKIYVLLIFVLSFSLIGWTIQESNHGTIGFPFPICLVDGASHAKECISSISINPFGDWYIKGNYFKFILSIFSINKINGLAEYLYIWGYCIIPCISLGYIITKISRSESNIFFGEFAKSYGLATAIGVIFFRDSLVYHGRTTAHSYLIIHSVIISCLQILFLNLKLKYNFSKNINLTLLLLIIPLLISYKNDLALSNRRLTDMLTKPMARVSFTIDDMNNFHFMGEKVCTSNKNKIKIFKKYLDKDNCGNDDIKHLFYSMKGVRTNVAKTAPRGQLKEWIIE